jgi:peroxiredoxin
VLAPGFGSRLVAGATITALIVLALWQAGVLFAPTTVTKDEVTVSPPDASIETPNPTGRTVGLQEGQLAPDFEFSAYDGSRQRLSDYRGKAVFLNFWATWCGPCRVELVDMETTLRQYGERGLVVLAVNNGESFERGSEFISDLGVELTAFAYDPDTSIVSRFDVRGMPTSFFIDRDGVITRTLALQVSLKAMQGNVEEALAGYRPN